MCAITINGIDDVLEREISVRADEYGLSTSEMALKILQDALIVGRNTNFRGASNVDDSWNEVLMLLDESADEQIPDEFPHFNISRTVEI